MLHMDKHTLYSLINLLQKYLNQYFLCFKPTSMFYLLHSIIWYTTQVSSEKVELVG